MNKLIDEFISKNRVRKTIYQKTLFLNWAKQHIEALGYAVKIEENGSLCSKNMIVGDPPTSDFILTAHYDTPAMNLFPFFQTPQSIFYTILHFLLRYGTIYMISVVLSIAFFKYIQSDMVLMLIIRYSLFVSAIVFSLTGIANRNNMNDNNSGIVTLLNLIQTMPPEYRNRVSFVFFDNNKKGLSGSSGFFLKYGERIYRKLLINLDCLGIGDYIVVIAPKKYRRSNDFYKMFFGAFGENPKKKLVIPYKLSLYLSDHIIFPNGISIASFNRNRMFGYCFGRIHTLFDTKLDEENISIVRDLIINLVCGQSAEKKEIYSITQINAIIKKPDTGRTVSSLDLMFRE